MTATSKNEVTYRNRKTGETLTVSAHWAQASSQIMGRWNGGEQFATPYQVADARHEPRKAAEMVARWDG